MSAKLYSVPTDSACPSWCVRWDHHADEVGPGMPATHYAEDIGACGPQGNGYTMEVISTWGMSPPTCPTRRSCGASLPTWSRRLNGWRRTPMSTATRTAEKTLRITCPAWCTVDAEDHLQQLWDLGGECIHYSAEVAVPDPGRGPHMGTLGAPQPAATATVSILATTSPQGHETESPGFPVHTPEYLSLQHFAALVEAMQQALETYRSWPQATRSLVFGPLVEQP